jgi:hypothetical protein
MAREWQPPAHRVHDRPEEFLNEIFESFIGGLLGAERSRTREALTPRYGRKVEKELRILRKSSTCAELILERNALENQSQ